MRGPRTLEILGIADRLPGKRLAHRNGVEHEITQKHPYGEDKQGGIGGQHSGCRIAEIRQVHSCSHEPVEKRHQHTGTHRNDYTFAVTRRRIIRFAHPPRSYSVENNGGHNQRNPGEQQRGIPLRLSHVIDNHTKNQGNPHP